jgi:flagellar biosynthesis protein FlhF
MNNNVTRFTARTAREAMNLVKKAFGDDAVVLSTKPMASGGVEMLAMGAEGVSRIEKAAKSAPTVRAAVHPVRAEPVEAPASPSTSSGRSGPSTSSGPSTGSGRSDPSTSSGRSGGLSADDVNRDVEQLAMSTLSFQDYVRERMLKRRQAQRDLATMAEPTPAPVEAAPARRSIDAPVLADTQHQTNADAARREQAMMAELRSMKGLIEDRFGALAFMEKLRTNPRRAALTQRLLDAGFSPALIRKLAEGLEPDCEDETTWAAGVLERNLIAADHEPALEDAGGVFALIGATGVGKTTSTAKIAAAFATQHGSANLGLVTLDAYRVGAQEQLRTYGRILGVPVHTAHDRASLEDLLELLSAKKMVLIDTAGMGQRDTRTRELMEMLSHRRVQKLLVVNASAQGETIDDVMVSYRAAACHGVVLSKIDEAVKLAPALDAIIRHKMRVVGVANGQRVPEDWHRLSAQALIQRALRASANSSWKLQANEVNLVFAGFSGATRVAVSPLHA